MSEDDRCHFCGKRIKYKVGGRRRLYCDEICKQKAYRRRRRDNADPTYVARQIAKAQARWRRRGYPDSFIEQLMALWEAYGGQAIDTIERLLTFHELWVITQVRAKDAKRNEP